MYPGPSQITRLQHRGLLQKFPREFSQRSLRGVPQNFSQGVPPGAPLGLPQRSPKTSPPVCPEVHQRCPPWGPPQGLRCSRGSPRVSLGGSPMGFPLRFHWSPQGVGGPSPGGSQGLTQSLTQWCPQVVHQVPQRLPQQGVTQGAEKSSYRLWAGNLSS
jgi:hypothetical protein